MTVVVMRCVRLTDSYARLLTLMRATAQWIAGTGDDNGAVGKRLAGAAI